MKVSMIVATDLNNAIGKNNTLPWHLPEDLKRFKSITLGKPIVMGRKTFESIGKALPGRLNIIVSRTLTEAPEGTFITPSLTKALEFLNDRKTEEVFIIGGGQLYKEALPYTTVVYMTKVHTQVDEPDTWFPRLKQTVWDIIAGETYRPKEPSGLFWSTLTLTRKLA